MTTFSSLGRSEPMTSRISTLRSASVRLLAATVLSASIAGIVPAAAQDSPSTPAQGAAAIAAPAVPAPPATDIAAGVVAAPAAIAPKPAAASQPALVQVDNPYGLDALWAQGDIVARGTLVILVIMSAATWYILFTKLFEQIRLGFHTRATLRSFWKAATVTDGILGLKPSNPLRLIAEVGARAIEHHEGTLVEAIDRHTWVTVSIQRAVDQITSRLQSGLAVLATVASTAPFVGLFGTVWGIYHALTAIGVAGQASIDKVAGPVGEALIMTAIGLAVAVPAVLGYNWMVRRNKSAVEKIRAFAADLHAVLLSGARLSDAPVSRRPATAVAAAAPNAATIPQGAAFAGRAA